MLRTDVLDVINSGEAWGFVGAGASTDAGLPVWADLVESVHQALVEEDRNSSLDVSMFSHAVGERDYPLAFELLEESFGREALEEMVKACLPSGAHPGTVTKLIADLPFAGYVTTNYDNLLEQALSTQLGWVPVGNTTDESAKVSGDARDVVWHLHGGLEIGSDRSNLVLTRRDYDATYVDMSATMRQLQGLLTHRRIVFMGFGFADDELVRLLKVAGRLTDVTRPAFAFVPAIGPFRHDIDRRVFMRLHNVDLIPYQVHGDSHRDLIETLNLYSALAVRRSIRLGSSIPKVPDFDPETTGLLIYNELVDRQELAPTVAHLRESLLDSRLLALLSSAPKSLDELVQNVATLARTLGQRVSGVLTEEAAAQLVASRCTHLQREGLVESRDGALDLSASGRERLSESLAKASLMRDKFRASLAGRAAESRSDASSAERVANAAASFLDECVRRRSLGVAMALAVDRSDQHAYQMVALLQNLKTQLSSMLDVGEAAALVRVVESVLSSPSQAESHYIGTAIQAGFGTNMLGFDKDTIEVRLRDLRDTTFVLDATTLIPALAVGSTGHRASARLLELLRQRGCRAITTDLLVREVAEHARWAQRKVAEAGAWQTPSVLEALLGRFGERSNDFLHGFVVEIDAGSCTGDFNSYLSSCFAVRDPRKEITDSDVAKGLAALGVEVLRDVRSVEGFAAQHEAMLATYDAQISARRKSNASWTHDRQVTAEAEALLLVDGLRAGEFEFEGQKSSGAYFVSHSQFLNEVSGSTLPPVLRQEAALQWFLALQGHDPESAAAVYDGLLWELQERRADIVDRQLLRRVFKPTIDASRVDLDAELERYRHQLAHDLSDMLGSEQLDELTIPSIKANAEAQTAQALEAKLAEANAKIYRLEREAEAQEVDAKSRVMAKKERGAERYRRRQERNKGR